MTKSAIYRKNGELKITFTINKEQSMLEMENEIELLSIYFKFQGKTNIKPAWFALFE
jgi:hypothetical protein